MSATETPWELSVEEVQHLLATRPDATLLLDVREPFELEICRVPGAQPIPMREIPAQLATLPHDRHILVLCHHGGRSRQVTRFMRENGLNLVSNVAGGINAWAERIDPALARY